MSGIAFSEVPAGTLVPWVYVEIDDSRAGSDEPGFHTLLLGHGLGAGSIGNGALVALGDAGDAAEKFGRGSMLHLMTARFRQRNPQGLLWGLAVAEAAGATAPTAVFTVTGNAMAAGTAVVYVAGRRYTAAVSSGDTPTIVAAALAAQINADPDAPATAAVGAGGSSHILTATARQKGAEIDLDGRTSYFADDTQPAGIDIAATANAGGGDVTLSAVLDHLQDRPFKLIVTPWTAAPSLTALEADIATRWLAAVQTDGELMGSRRGTLAEQQTWYAGRSSRFSCVMDQSDAPQCEYEWAAEIAGAVSLSAASDPALPFQTLDLSGLLAPSLDKQRIATEREQLLRAGMSTITSKSNYSVAIERMVTTSGESKWRNLNTVLTVSYLRENFRERLRAKFPRFKLRDDTDRLPEPEERIVTPLLARAEAIAWARDMEDRGLIESAEAFKAGLVVRRNTNDKDRLDFAFRPDVINQLRVIGALMQFEE